MAKLSTRQGAVSWRKAHFALVIGALLAAVLATAGCSAKPETAAPVAETAPAAEATAATEAPATAEATEAAPATGTKKLKTVTELKIKDTKVGKGAKVKTGDTVTVHYTGWLMDGTKFDSSVDRKEPFEFAVGTGYVIPGWDQGVVGMKVGGKRELIIPSDLGYGPQGTPDGSIPPGATLKFEIQLLKITPA